jgi:hypothetical protein
MTDTPPSYRGPESDAPHRALVGLHALSDSLGGVEPGDVPGFRPSSPGADLRAVAEAPESEIPVSARIGVLHALARADFPHYDSTKGEYHLLAESVARAREVDPDELLSDLKRSASEGVPFETTTTGQALPHRDVAFVGHDLCETRTVQVGELTAAWVFSEFETDAPFEQVVGWIDPRSWPARGPMLFKGMSLVGADEPVDISGLGDEHWHGVFHEKVQLVRELNTLLHCDYWRDGDSAAGMTYDLALSLDGELDVDRGFLSVNDLGSVRRVKALKIVGFTEDVWDDVARMVCPFWTDWVRGAVEGGSSSTPHAPSHQPGGAQPSPTEVLSEGMQAWFDFFGDSARTYLDLMADMSSRATSGGYSTSDWLADGTRYWSALAKDWAKAWTYGLEMLDDIARDGLDAGFAPPGSPRSAMRGVATAMTGAASGQARAGDAAPTAGAAEVTTIPVVGLAPDDQPVVSPLVSIEAGGATIPASDLIVSVQQVDEQTYGVRLECTDTSVAPGLYVGHLKAMQGSSPTPVQLYVARATEAGRP